MESKSIIVFYLKFLADNKIIMESIIVFIDDAHTAIGRWYLQYLQQMPFGTAKIIRFPTPSIVMINFGSFIRL